jgi:hypothetical protein
MIQLTSIQIDNWSFWLVKMSIDPLVKNTQVKKTMLKLTCANGTKLDQGATRPKWGSFWLIFAIKKVKISCSGSWDYLLQVECFLPPITQKNILLEFQCLSKHYNFVSKPCFDGSFQLLVWLLIFHASLFSLFFPFLWVFCPYNFIFHLPK